MNSRKKRQSSPSPRTHSSHDFVGGGWLASHPTSHSHNNKKCATFNLGTDQHITYLERGHDATNARTSAPRRRYDDRAASHHTIHCCTHTTQRKRCSKTLSELLCRQCTHKQMQSAALTHAWCSSCPCTSALRSAARSLRAGVYA